ncbi:disease resistance protein RPM1-like protein [Cinnamomum micranthum f. kanehirae]|uniref:Disease resistance protein RPM1-like protein n=1 Tax=Cinnamomum micranthum f. kanehirae TaxID=337451 RepID=A0A443NU68_9MAGN|nr:disease resistance protein RPM1-like protein [Cinnamomum micranthum f. kanehirae]
MEDPLDSSLHIGRDEIVGIEDSMQKLVGWLTDERSLPLQLTSVVGMSGSGKTVLVKQVYDNQRVKAHFQCRAWIKVPHPCRTNDLLKLIVDEFYNETSRHRMEASERIELTSRSRLVDTLRGLLNLKRYVLVLDGVWDVDVLSDIKNALPCHGNGSRIIVTTTLINTVEAYDRVCQVEPLLAPHDNQLFIKKAFPAANLEEVPPQLDDLSRKILARCEGLPLAIVTIGNLLRNKGADVREWEKVCTSSFDGSRAMSKLTFSYRAMPDHLKPLLMYLGVFPEGQLIKRMRLIRLWIAEGFIEEKEKGTMEENANEYLNELIGHSVIQVAERSNCGWVKSCKVHPLMLSFIVSKAKEQNFYVFSTKRYGASTSNAKIRRLSISGDDTNGSHDSDLSHARSFFAFGTSQFRMEQLCSKFRCLRVLDLESAPLTDLPKSLADLIFLRYLSLANTRIRSLPKTIEKLEHIQTLNLKGTSIINLPNQILKLKKLRHLLAYNYVMDVSPFDCIQAVRVPRGIESLTALQKLSVIQANGENGIIRELGKLTQLRRLGIVGLRNADGQSICSSIAQMTNLNSFSAKSTNASELLNLDYHFSPPPNLQRVYLRGRLMMLPSWIRTHQQLTRLTLGWSYLEQDPFQELHVLGSLKELTLLEAYGGNSLYCRPSGKGKGGFPNLILLCLDGLPWLQYIQLEKGAMPKLQKMIIGRCTNLSLAPLGIECLTMLKQMELFAMSLDFMSNMQAERRVFLPSISCICDVIVIEQLRPLRQISGGIKNLKADDDVTLLSECTLLCP